MPHVVSLQDAVQASEPQVAPRAALRLAGPAAARPPAETFWREYHRRRSMNHVALMLSARAVESALAAGDAIDDGVRRRLRVALDEYAAVQRSLRERVGELGG